MTLPGNGHTLSISQLSRKRYTDYCTFNERDQYSCNYGEWGYLHVPSGTTLFARPNSYASLAPISLPVRMRSNARESPTNLGKRTVPPSVNGTPEGGKFKQ